MPAPKVLRRFRMVPLVVLACAALGLLIGGAVYANADRDERPDQHVRRTQVLQGCFVGSLVALILAAAYTAAACRYL